MLKRIEKPTPRGACIFDAEWIPDVDAGRRYYQLPDDMSDRDVQAEMYAKAGATPESPTPFLKLALSRVVCIGFVWRIDGNFRVGALTNYGLDGEASMISTFLEGVAKQRVQLVGFNSRNADLPIMLQRATMLGGVFPKFCERPEKPWMGVDYFDKYSGWHIDLCETFGGFSKGATPSLGQLCSIAECPVPKEMSGADVAEMWDDSAEMRQKAIHYCVDDAVRLTWIYLRVLNAMGPITSSLPALDAQLMAARAEYLATMSASVAVQSAAGAVG